MKFFYSFTIALLAFTASAITATKEYVDRKDGELKSLVFEVGDAIRPVAQSVTRQIVTKEYVEKLGVVDGKRGLDDLDYTNEVVGISIRVTSGDQSLTENVRNLKSHIESVYRRWGFDVVNETGGSVEHFEFGYLEDQFKIRPVGTVIFDGYTPRGHFHVFARKINGSQTSVDKIVLKAEIPAWALESSPPSGMPDNAIVWDSGSLSTKDGTKTIGAADVGAASSTDVESAEQKAADALAYSTGIFNYMNANTNAWFAGTNYVVGAQAASRHRFAFEPGMDLATVPCSMALMELRDGVKAPVWDQRDWVSWYWSFKSSQMMAKIAETNAAIRAEIAARAPAAWSQRTAATGLVNPDATTTWIDTEKVVLSPGMAWETVAEVGGCAYWTIVGRGTVGGSAADNVLTIKDFEGKPVLKIKKGESYQAYLECGSEIYTSGRDSQGRVTFTMRANVKPIAEFSTTLEEGSFVAEDDENCPTAFEWENVSAGVWRIHFLLKPTISSSSCFAKFKVDVEGQTTIEYTASQTITGGLIYNGVKIAPVVTGGAAVGTTVTWKVVP